MLFSATMPGAVINMARRYMVHPTHISAVHPEVDSVIKRDIRQLVYRPHHMDKDELLARALQARDLDLTIIVTLTKRTAARVADELHRRRFAAGALRGDLVLVAGGIDVENVTHLFTFQTPEDENPYLQRVGRTGRAGHKGIAVTLVDWEDVPRWKLIAQALGIEQVEPVETYSASPHLYQDLDIPEDAKGRLPKSQRTREGLDAEKAERLGGPDRQRGGRRRGQHGGRKPRGRGCRGRSQNRQRQRTRSGKPVNDSSGDKQQSKTGKRRQRTRTRRHNGQVV